MRIKLEPGRISAREAAAWAGVKEGTHGTWVTQGLLPRSGTRGYDMDDVVRLYILSRLVRTIGFDRARTAWLQVRDALPEVAAIPTYLKLVVGEVAPISELAYSPAGLDAIVSSGEPIRVITLHPLISKVADWYAAKVRSQWTASSSSAAQTRAARSEVQC
jgi:hypothetical protein